MDLSSATVLLTGVSSGIGLGLAHEFLQAGSTVIITGRREDPLKAAQAKYPKLRYIVNDVGSAQQREQLLATVLRDYPEVNILINNAGILHPIGLVDEIKQATPWEDRATEIEINLSAPIHLSTLFIPHLLTKKESAIINVTSGIAFVPLSAFPVYCATKAALHSFTMSLRITMKNTSCRIVELVPPAVKSNLGGKHDFGEECDVFCASVFKRFAAGELEFGMGFADQARLGSRQEAEEIAMRMHKQFQVKEF